MKGSNEARACLHTLRDCVRWAASRFTDAGLFFGHGTDNALDEALALVLHALHLDHNLPEAYLDTRLTTGELEQVVALIGRRVDERIPAAYLTHEAWFAGLSFYVDDRVLVPRSPIAELIEARFEPWVDVQACPRVLDLCTGSGCIAVACALAFREAEVIASDLSEAALEVAAINVRRHGLEDRLDLIRSDLFSDIPAQLFDLVVSNPPYVPDSTMEVLPREYLHEPALGLAAGRNGLDLVIRLLAQAGDYLAPGGVLVVEVGEAQDALSERFPEVPFLWLEFDRGGEGVFLLTAEQVAAYGARFGAAGAELSVAP